MVMQISACQPNFSSDHRNLARLRRSTLFLSLIIAALGTGGCSAKPVAPVAAPPGTHTLFFYGTPGLTLWLDVRVTDRNGVKLLPFTGLATPNPAFDNKLDANGKLLSNNGDIAYALSGPMPDGSLVEYDLYSKVPSVVLTINATINQTTPGQDWCLDQNN